MMNSAVPQGFRLAGVRCGLKEKGLDLGLIFGDKAYPAAAVFTTNRMAAVSVLINREQIRAGKARALLVNAGCANACSGPKGEASHRRVVESFSRLAEIPEKEIFLSSTGIIGPPLSDDKIVSALKPLLQSASPEVENFAKAIITTDTVEKISSRTVTWENKTYRVLGIVKGAGMIHPKMATMLAFILTDATVSPAWLKITLARVVPETFNSISVDGDTSTNDSLFLLASGKVPGPGEPAGKKALREGIFQVCHDLADQIVADGEGATRMVRIKVSGAPTRIVARKVAERVATSLLVKTALFGQDPNWGRIAAAVGIASDKIRPGKVTISLGDVTVFSGGQPTSGAADLDSLRQRVSVDPVEISIDLGLGRIELRMTTCDLSEEYVSINASYHT